MTALRAAFPRISEFLDGVMKTNRRRAYFEDFEKSIAANPVKRKHFEHIESDLAGLDEAAWAHLKSEVANKFKLNRPPRGWQFAFDILNEAKAYNYLVRLGCSDVTFIPVSLAKTPDLQARLGTVPVLCEVKTINPSNMEAAARQEIEPRPRSIQSPLPDAFLRKISNTLQTARGQMDMFSDDARVHRIIYVVLNFDDNLNEHVASYMEQMRDFALALPPSNVDIVFDVKTAFYSATVTSPPSQLFVCSKERAWQAL